MFLRFAIPSAGDVRSESYANLRETAGKQPPHKHENQQQTSSLHAVFLIPEDLLSHFWQKYAIDNERLTCVAIVRLAQGVNLVSSFT